MQQPSLPANIYRTRVKICGLTQTEDVDYAVSAGADAIGLVFYPPSPRYVTPEQGRALRERLPAFVDCVALFVNASRAEVSTVIQQVKPDLLQFHGDESPEFCDSFGQRYLRAFRLGGPHTSNAAAVLDECSRYPNASAWLFDSFSSGYGGSGLSFDPGLLAEVAKYPLRRPLVFAGGLTPQTVGAAIAGHQPYAVDVSSGVEQSPGIKSAEKIGAFMCAIKAVQAN